MTTDDETRAMSRMLTQGATMLGEACGDCNSPLFRYEGRVVCAVCGEAKEGDGAEDGADGTDASERTDSSQTEDTDLGTVDDSLRLLAERLARGAAEHADEPDEVERRLDALERTLELLR